MNANMVALSKGAISVIVVVSAAIAVIATLMGLSPDGGPRAGRGDTHASTPASTPASASAPAGKNAAAPGGA